MAADADAEYKALQGAPIMRDTGCRVGNHAFHMRGLRGARMLKAAGLEEAR